MYVVVVVLSIAGDQVPVIPFVEVVESVNVPPEQIAAIGLNVGVVDGFTDTLNVVVVAHCPTAGVNVYVKIPGVEVLIAVFHVPVIPKVLVDVVGSNGATLF